MPKKSFFPALWALIKPYWVSEKRAVGLILLATVVGLTLFGVWLEVQFNTWNRDFYNTFESRDEEEFFRQFGMFTLLAILYIFNAVYRIYFQQMLMIEWRAWLTERFIASWLRDRAYYLLQMKDKGTDNPDQRIAEDLNGFVDLTLTLSLGFLSAVVTLVSFIGILWTISGPATLFGFEVPGYMVWVALAYAIAGTWLTHLIGRPLIRIGFPSFSDGGGGHAERLAWLQHHGFAADDIAAQAALNEIASYFASGHAMTDMNARLKEQADECRRCDLELAAHIAQSGG